MKRNRVMLAIALTGISVGMSQAGMAQSTPPQPDPAAAPEQWLSSNDYPPEALRQRIEGTVKAKMEIGPDGKVSNCHIEESSGSAVLDDQTCAILSARAHFRPDTDAKGKPIASYARRTVTWRLPKTPPGSHSLEEGIAREAAAAAAKAGKADGPFKDYWVQMDFDVAADGTVSNCRIAFEGTLENATLPFMCQFGKIQPFVDRDGKPTARHVRKLQRVDLSDPTP